MTTEQATFERGFIACNQCPTFVYVFRAELLRKLPDDYAGELCDQCGAWVCRRDKIPCHVAKDGE